jgi:hypothetical protein
MAPRLSHSNNRTKDANERIFIEQFRQVYRFFPDGVLTKGVPNKEPDFILTNSGGKLGIEMARLYRDHGKDQFGVLRQSKFQALLVQKARSEYEQRRLPRYRIYVSFHERSGISSKNLNSLSNALVEIISKRLKLSVPSKNGRVTLGTSDLFPYEKTFSLIQIYDQSEYFEFDWSINNSFSVDPLNKEVLRTTIQDKELKRQRGLYSKGASLNQIGLLLYMDFSDHAMDQSVSSEFTYPIASSGFDKIIIFKTIENNCRVIWPPQFCSPLA